MRIHALLSWFREQPEHLTELVESIAPLVDGILAIDGAYRAYPNATAASPQDNEDAITDAARANNLYWRVVTPDTPWQGGEVEKRATMFDLALQDATPFEDWFLIVDGDQLLDAGVDAKAAREALQATPLHVAEVTSAEVAYGGTDCIISSQKHRSLFRAIPGMTVEGTHWFYTAPINGRKAFLWHGGGDARAPEPALDLSGEVCLLHRPHVREPGRVRDRQAYYVERDRAAIERVPPYGV